MLNEYTFRKRSRYIKPKINIALFPKRDHSLHFKEVKDTEKLKTIHIGKKVFLQDLLTC